MEVQHRAEVDVREHVPGDDEERLVELAHSVADRTRRPEGRLLAGVGDAGPKLGPIAEIVLDGMAW